MFPIHSLLLLQEQTNGLSSEFREWANLSAVGAIIVVLLLIALYLPRLHKEQRAERDDFRRERKDQQNQFLCSLQEQRDQFREELHLQTERSERRANEGHQLVRDLLATLRPPQQSA